MSSQFISSFLDSGLILILFWASWTYAPLVIAIGCLQVLLLIFSTRTIRRLASNELEAVGKAQGYTTEMLAGITTIKVDRAERHAYKHSANLFSIQLVQEA